MSLSFLLRCECHSCPAANKNRGEENTSNSEIRQWESDHPSHAVDAVDALEKNAGGPDDITTESAT